MINCRVEPKPSFTIVGRKTWIGGTAPDNALFGMFWEKCGQDGFLQSLGQASGGKPGEVTGGVILGVSCIEDPQIRNFHYFIAMEQDGKNELDAVEEIVVPPCTWAIFNNTGRMPEALVEAEMEAFLTWLPASGLRHAGAPEMEVYLPGGSGDEVSVEFWLPVEAIPQCAGAEV